MQRRYVAFILILFSCILTTAGSGEGNTSVNSTDEEWYTLTDNVAGFSIGYPAGTEVWQADQKDVYRDLMITTPANVTMVKVTYLPGNTTLGQLEERQVASLKELSNLPG